MGRTQECESLSAQHSGKSLNAVLAIALNISQILGECNDDCKDCHKHCNESAHNTRGGGTFQYFKSDYIDSHRHSESMLAEACRATYAATAHSKTRNSGELI